MDLQLDDVGLRHGNNGWSSDVALAKERALDETPSEVVAPVVVQDVSGPAEEHVGGDAAAVSGDAPQGIKSLIAAVFPASEVATALRICACESTMGQDPNAYLPGRRYVGAMQVSTEHLGDTLAVDMNLYDDVQNIQAAYLLWQRFGWGIWTCL